MSSVSGFWFLGMHFCCVGTGERRAGNAARDCHDDEIDARHIQAGISADDELVQVSYYGGGGMEAYG